MYVNVLGVLTATHSPKKPYTFSRFITHNAKQYATDFGNKNGGNLSFVSSIALKIMHLPSI